MKTNGNIATVAIHTNLKMQQLKDPNFWQLNLYLCMTIHADQIICIYLSISIRKYELVQFL